MLAYLLSLNRFVYDIYMEDIANVICKIHHLHLEQYFIQQQHDLNCRYLCIIIVSLLKFIYIFWGRENSQDSMLDNPEYNKISIENYHQ